MKKILFVVTILLIATTLFACNGEVVGVEAKEPTVKVALGSTVDLTALFTVEGTGTPDFSVTPTDILTPSGKKWIAAKEGECVVTAYAGERYASVTVRVVDTKRVAVTLSDATFVYDGTTKNLAIEGTLPKGSVVEYRVDGRLFSGATEPGEYEVTADVTVPKGYFVEYEKKTARLTITKKTLSVDSLHFRSMVTTYDGQEKSLTLEGQIPDGATATIRYYVDGQEVPSVKDAGVYDGRVTFSVDERYYEDPPVLSARLTVRKKDLVEGSLDRTISTTYDGSDHFPTLDLPDGLTADYSVSYRGEYLSKSAFYAAYDGRAFVDSGRYEVRAALTLSPELVKNYAAPSSATLIAEIGKAEFDSGLQWRDGSAVYTGQPFVLGYGDYPFGLYGSLPHGVNGEYPSVPVRFLSNGVLADTHSYTDAGKYGVIAKFDLPEGYEKNYLPLPDLRYTVVIEKAPYPVAFTFPTTDRNGVDFSSGIVYDGLSHEFSLKFDSEADETTFLNDCNVLYYYRKDYAENRVTSNDKVTVVDVGAYTIGYEVSFKNASVVKNYVVPAAGRFDTEIRKVVYDMTSVRFSSDTVVYDGSVHTLTPTGVPDGVSWTVTGGDKTDAGRYYPTVKFTPTEYPASACVLRGENGTVNELTAVLNIEKATYTSSDVPACSTEEAVYSSLTTLADRAVLAGGQPTDLVKWKTPSTVPTCDRTKYEAVYNADEKNYVGYVFLLDLVTTPATLNAALFSVREQFLPYDGKAARPVYDYEGEEVDPEAYRLSYTVDEGDDGKSIGTHILRDMTVVLVDETNYRLTGESDLGDVTVHIYDRNLWTYDGLTLKKYLGFGTTVTVPEGTAAIFREAFDGKGMTSLTVPSSVTSLSESALAGTSSLTSLTLPFLGKTGGGALADVFGQGGLPSTLTSVTVTEENTVGENAFKNCARLSSISYRKPVLSVGERAFFGCSSLTSLSLPDLTSLGKDAFCGCYALTTLTLPFIGETNFTETAEYLFGGNAGDNTFDKYRLQTLDLRSGGFTAVPARTFSGLTTLNDVFLPDTVNDFAYFAFAGISACVRLPDGLIDLSSGAFADYEGTEVTLPDGLLSIGDDAFNGADDILIIYIPQKVTSIGQRAFCGIAARIDFAAGSRYTRVGTKTFAGYAGTGVSLPDGVTDIDDYAFEGSAITAFSSRAALGKFVFSDCRELTTAVLYTEVLPEGTFKNCEKLGSLSLPNLTVVGKNACENCLSLESLDLPSTVGEINNYAFDGCNGLALIALRATAVPTLGVRALPVGVAVDLYVPSSSLSAYRTAIENAGYNNITVRALA